MVKTKIVSSLEKIFLNDRITRFKELRQISMLRNQRLSIQLLCTETTTPDTGSGRIWARPTIVGPLAEYATIRTVEYIPSTMPVYQDRQDVNYLSTQPGLFPDLLQPLHNRGCVPVVANQLRSVWIDFDPQGALEGGVYPTVISLADMNGTLLIENTIEIKVLPAFLPEQELIVTQWFHCDCLADYYRVDVFSEAHWTIIENFIKTAVKNGQNMILTPIITPAFDTDVGYERPTVQLVQIAVEDGKYTFDFSLLTRWMDMCKRLGIRYFEMPPFFTQWGATNAPKIMATVHGEYKRIFGWETDAAGEEYGAFLSAFIPALLEFLKARGDDHLCYYHMSDEPSKDHLEQYKKSKENIKNMLSGYHAMDALSNYEFYLEGAVDTPIPATNHITPFLEGKVENLWCYYCCGQCIDVSNRLFAMPSARTRIIGTQMYKYNIAGFLQWGYNFYYNQYSRDMINPYFETTGEYFVQSGDAYSVYPAVDGTALESLRIVVFHEALEDLRAMRLCEQYYGHDKVVEEIEKVYGEVRFDKCPSRSDEMLAIRRRIDEMIEAKL